MTAQILGAVKIPGVAEEAGSGFFLPVGLALPLYHRRVCGSDVGLMVLPWSLSSVCRRAQPAWSMLQLGRGWSRARRRLQDLRSGPGRPELYIGHGGAEWLLLVAWLAARGRVGRPSRTGFAGREESPVSFLFDLGGFPSSETQQRPGSQRPCFRQVGSSGRIRSLLSFLPSDSSTGARVPWEMGDPKSGIWICFLLWFFIQKGSLQNWMFTCFQFSVKVHS